MRRRSRRKNNSSELRSIIIWSVVVLLLAGIAFIAMFIIYNNKIRENRNVSFLSSTKVSELVPSIQVEEQTEDVSLSIGKTVEEIENNSNSEIQENIIDENVNEPEKVERQENINEIVENANVTKEEQKELIFKMPVQGEIIADFAKDNLIYSDTLKEWITHLGIDIAAEKTSVVKSAETGVVKSIKNDPRYGLTVTIEHSNNFKSVYSNLFTAEFIVEGEKVSQGQTIGTIGTTAVFEAGEQPHLHFELLKDDEYVDPTIYLKY